jgi:hypothetical protein
MKRSILLTKTLLVLGLLISSHVTAGTVFTPVLMSLEVDGTTVREWSWELDPGQADVYQYQGGWMNSDVALSWDMQYDPDPYIFSNISIINLSSVAKTFTINTTLPISPSFSSSYMGGSVFAQVTDQNGNGAASLAQPPIYRGKVDGATVLELLSFIGSTSCSGAGCSTTVSDYDGLPGVVFAADPRPVGASLPGPGALSTIAMTLMFTLSAGDRADFSSYFEVTPVPLPAAFWLLLSSAGLMGGFFRRSLVPSIQ